MEGDIHLYRDDSVMMLASYLFIRSRDKKKLHLRLRKEYFLGPPGALQYLRQQKLYHSSLLMPYLSP
eukprot:6772061-Ditylum_brightwellii.AAC.1